MVEATINDNESIFMPPASPLWSFAHRALAPQFFGDPARFLKILDVGNAPGYLEDMWAWALSTAGVTSRSKPPVSYRIDRPRPGLAIIAMRFQGVTQTGEPWEIRFIVREADPDRANGYARMFLLEHDEYMSETNRRPTAVVCEEDSQEVHRLWGGAQDPADSAAFDAFVVATVSRTTT